MLRRAARSGQTIVLRNPATYSHATVLQLLLGITGYGDRGYGSLGYGCYWVLLVMVTVVTDPWLRLLLGITGYHVAHKTKKSGSYV